MNTTYHWAEYIHPDLVSFGLSFGRVDSRFRCVLYLLTICMWIAYSEHLQIHTTFFFSQFYPFLSNAHSCIFSMAWFSEKRYKTKMRFSACHIWWQMIYLFENYTNFKFGLIYNRMYAVHERRWLWTSLQQKSFKMVSDRSEQVGDRSLNDRHSNVFYSKENPVGSSNILWLSKYPTSQIYEVAYLLWVVGYFLRFITKRLQRDRKEVATYVWRGEEFKIVSGICLTVRPRSLS